MSIAVESRKTTPSSDSATVGNDNPISPKFPPRTFLINFGDEPSKSPDKKDNRDRQDRREILPELVPAIAAANLTLSEINKLNIRTGGAWQAERTKQITTAYGIHTEDKEIGLRPEEQWQNVAKSNLTSSLNNASALEDVFYWTGATFRLAQTLQTSSGINYINSKGLEKLEPKTLVKIGGLVDTMLKKIEESGSIDDKKAREGIIRDCGEVLQKIKTGKEENDTAAANALSNSERVALITAYARSRVVTRDLPASVKPAAGIERVRSDMPGYEKGISVSLPKDMPEKERDKVVRSITNACASVREVFGDKLVDAVARRPVEFRLAAKEIPTDKSGVQVVYIVSENGKISEIDPSDFGGALTFLQKESNVASEAVLMNGNIINNPSKVAYYLAQRAGRTLVPPPQSEGSRTLTGAAKLLERLMPRATNAESPAFEYGDRLRGLCLICSPGALELAHKIRTEEVAARGTAKYTPELAREVEGMKDWALAYANIVVNKMSLSDYLMGKKENLITDPKQAWSTIEASQAWKAGQK